MALRMKKIGTREEVWAGAAQETAGGLKRSALFFDAVDRKIKSKAASSVAKKRNAPTGGGFLPGNIQAAGVTLPGGRFLPGNIQAAGGVTLPGGGGGAFGGFLGGGVTLPGGGMSGAGMDGAGVKRFIAKVLRAISRFSPKIRRAINSTEAKVVSDLVTEALVKSGIPKAQVAGLTLRKILPIVKRVVSNILAAIEASQKKGGGVFVPGM